MTTEGIFLTKYGKTEQAFEQRTFELSDPKANEVQIEIESFGLNYADVMARNKLYREAPALPCVLGYDVVGKVTKVGSSVSQEWLGKRVLAFTRFGGYAKHVNTAIHGVVEIGDIHSNQALALCTQYVTAYYMSNYVTNIYENDRVLIHAAAGGVGLALIQLAKAKNAIVYAKVSSDEKAQFVKNLGADFTINYTKSDYQEQLFHLLKENRLDVSFNPAAGTTFKKDFKLLGAGGKLILFGGSERSGKNWGIFSTLNFVFKMGFMMPIVLMMTSKSVIGVNMLKIGDQKPDVLARCLQEVLKLYHQGLLQPIEGIAYKATEIALAHEKLESGTSIGKLSIDW